MKPLKQYLIPFSGLKIGKHNFEFDVDKSFFDAFDYSLVKDGNLKVEMEMDKQENMLILNFKIAGKVMVTCDRCLSVFPTPLEAKERQIVKFMDDKEEGDEIIVLSRNEHEIDVSGLVYEFITVAVPYVNECEQAGDNTTCDKEMLDKLQELAGNKEEEQETTTKDPRWDALKKLTDK